MDGIEVNGLSKDKYPKIIEFGRGRMDVLKNFPVNVGLIRGTTADEKGNVTFEKEAISLEALPIAQAVKASGGVVIVQVEYLAKAGTPIRRC